MKIPRGKLKRGDRVTVSFEGIIINPPRRISQADTEAEQSVRISVKPSPGKYSWWAVVPLSAVKVSEDNEQSAK